MNPEECAWETRPRCTIMSVDGVGAFDLVSRNAMLRGLMSLPSGGRLLPFVRMFCGQPSVFLWEDETGEVHHIQQGEGGEQGDPLMPLLTLSPSACSSFADFTFPSLCPHACADVAVHLILVVTIGLRVLWQGFLGKGVSRWRVQLPGCHGPGHGLAPSSCIGWQKTGSCCRRSPTLQRCTTGD